MAAPSFMLQTGCTKSRNGPVLLHGVCGEWKIRDENERRSLEVVQWPSSRFVFPGKCARMQHASLPDSTICVPMWRQVRREPTAKGRWDNSTPKWDQVGCMGRGRGVGSSVN